MTRSSRMSAKSDRSFTSSFMVLVGLTGGGLIRPYVPALSYFIGCAAYFVLMIVDFVLSIRREVNSNAERTR